MSNFFVSVRANQNFFASFPLSTWLLNIAYFLLLFPNCCSLFPRFQDFSLEPYYFPLVFRNKCDLLTNVEQLVAAKEIEKKKFWGNFSRFHFIARRIV